MQNHGDFFPQDIPKANRPILAQYDKTGIPQGCNRFGTHRQFAKRFLVGDFIEGDKAVRVAVEAIRDAFGGTDTDLGSLANGDAVLRAENPLIHRCKKVDKGAIFWGIVPKATAIVL